VVPTAAAAAIGSVPAQPSVADPDAVAIARLNGVFKAIISGDLSVYAYVKPLPPNYPPEIREIHSKKVLEGIREMVESNEEAALRLGMTEEQLRRHEREIAAEAKKRRFGAQDWTPIIISGVEAGERHGVRYIG
jgi:hypothetical protein